MAGSRICDKCFCHRTPRAGVSETVSSGTVYLHDEPAALRFEIRGPLDRALAREILDVAATALSIRNGRDLVLDLRRADDVDARIIADLSRRFGAGVRMLAREDQLEPLAAAAQRPPQPAGEEPLPLLRRIGCAFLRWFRPGCACQQCGPRRVWSF